MSKILKWGLLSVLAVGLIIKLSLWWSVRSIMDDAISKLSPVMDITYGGITSSFDGRVGLEKLQLRVPAMGDRVAFRLSSLTSTSGDEPISWKSPASKKNM